LIRWIPIIWNDRDWDYHYLLKVLRAKIGFMYKSTQDWLRIDYGEISVEMLRAIELLDNCLYNRHEEAAYTLHTHLHGDSKWVFTGREGTHKLDGIERPFRTLEINYPDADDQEVAIADLMRLSRAAYEQHSADLQELFELLKGLERWWD
jgi:hypothetical protein